MPLPAGKFNKRIRFQYPSKELDDLNQPFDTWTTLPGVIPANIVSIGNSESNETLQTVSHEKYQITIRYRSGISSLMRVQWGAKTFNIESVAPPKDDQNNRELVILCSS